MQKQAGITFATHDGVALLGDLYRPDGPGPFPAVIAVHGGGWQAGSRSAYQYWGADLTAAGYAVFAIDYRLAKPGQKTFPEAVNDVRAAVQFLRGTAADHRIDAARLALMGDSAGAHLASLVTLAGDAPLFAEGTAGDAFGTVSTKVKACIGLYGVYDLAAQWQHDLIARPKDQIAEKFLGAAPIDDRKLYFDASPLSYAIRANNHAAFFLAYGTADDIVDIGTQSQAFLLALKQAGIFARTAILEGAPHFWGSDPIEEPGSFSGFLAPRLKRFLAERL